MKASIIRVGVSAAIVIGMACPSHADEIADFYRHKSVSLVLGMGEGGGFAGAAQAIAPYLTKHIPGNPAVVVQYMPGAGGLRAMQYFASVAARDGSVIGMVYASNPFSSLFGVLQATYDPRQMNWLGAMTHEATICSSWTASGIATWNDLVTKQFLIGSSGVGSTGELYAAALDRFFDAKIKVISGYKSVNDVYLAMERGEVNGYCGSPLSSFELARPGWFESGKVKVPIQFALSRDARLPESPTVMEVAPDDTARDVFRLLLAPQGMGRPFLAPPGVPADKLAALRAGFDAAINDPEFLAEARRQRMQIDETTGAEVADGIARAYAVPEKIVQLVKETINLTGDAK